MLTPQRGQRPTPGMSNILSDDKQQQVLALGRLGWTLRRIESATGVRRETAAKYLRTAGVPVRSERRRTLANPASEVSTDSAPVSKAASDLSPDSKPASEVSTDLAEWTAAAAQQVPERPGPNPSASACEPYRELIETGVERGRTARAIYEDLVDLHGFTAAYASVMRFVRRLRSERRPDQAHPVIVTEPGLEAQVDYGDGPMVRDPETGKYRRVRLFAFTLGCSRKAIWLLTPRSSSEIWCRLHEQAFARLGGAPRIVVLDNLREGVLKPDVYDPALNPLYRDMLAHYGAIAMPCRVRDPDRKGKVESSVNYGQRRLIGLRFESLASGQAYIDRWETNWADTRIHGTTKRQVAAMFDEERPHLLALPALPFRYYRHGMRTVHLDGYVEVDRAYYAPPPGYLGRDLAVQWDDLVVRILDPKTGELLREHRKAKPGGRRMRDEDRPTTTPAAVVTLLGRAESSAPAIGSVCQAIFARRSTDGVRQIQGVLGLSRKYGVALVDDACRTALDLGVAEYRFVRRYLERSTSALPSLKQIDPIIRELAYYRDLINARTGGNPE
jgi:transposase